MCQSGLKTPLLRHPPPVITSPQHTTSPAQHWADLPSPWLGKPCVYAWPSCVRTGLAQPRAEQASLALALASPVRMRNDCFKDSVCMHKLCMCSWGWHAHLLHRMTHMLKLRLHLVLVSNYPECEWEGKPLWCKVTDSTNPSWSKCYSWKTV